jgi:hypothetical protein
MCRRRWTLVVVLWFMTPCKLVGGYRRVGVSRCLLLLHWSRLLQTPADTYQIKPFLCQKTTIWNALIKTTVFWEATLYKVSEKCFAFIFGVGYSDNGGSTFFRNIRKFLPDYTASYPRRS